MIVPACGWPRTPIVPVAAGSHASYSLSFLLSNAKVMLKCFGFILVLFGFYLGFNSVFNLVTELKKSNKKA